MIEFFGKRYELFFSNKLPPLIALNYADEKFFAEFENLCGKQYRILSIIRSGWQQKYGLEEDIEQLRLQFMSMLSDGDWSQRLLTLYHKRSLELRAILELLLKKDYSTASATMLIKDLQDVRNMSAVLDAMSNMLHLFSSLLGHTFFTNLQRYSDNSDTINENFIFFTQPLKESKFAKIQIQKLDTAFALTPEDARLSTPLRLGAFVKDDVSELLEQRKICMHDLFVRAGQILGSDPADLEYLQLSEIGESLKLGKVSHDLITQRKSLSILFYPEKRLEVYAGTSAENLLRKGKFKELPTEKKEILLGQTASLGHATGMVIVAHTSEEANKKMKQGNILVAPYTAVEYLPAMKKAAAILTETGGITSHAAIISREFKIPCVIGIKDVTKLLKDGQKVEINADKGTITIL